MRIQEMRSGLSHFKKREDEAVSNNMFEMRSLLDPDLLDEPDADADASTTTPSAEASFTPPEQAAELEAASELDQQIWSVVSFERVEAGSLNYQQAMAWMDELQLQGVAGLCIVTDEAAKRIKA